VGAWIETGKTMYLVETDIVAPCVGAWIETFANFSLMPIVCRALRGRVD